MTFIEFAYIISGIIALGAGIPQVHQLIVEKRSEELSLSSWSVWASAQVVAFLYAMSINNVTLIIMNGMWVAFYVFMVVLVVKYRPRPRLAVESDSIEPELEPSLQANQS